MSTPRAPMGPPAPEPGPEPQGEAPEPVRRIPVRRIVVRPDEVLQPDRRPFASFPLTRLVTWSVGVSTAIVAAFLAIAALIAWLLAPDRIR